MPICSISARVLSGVTNASPPALSTNTLFLKMRRYGSAWRNAVMTMARSFVFCRVVMSSALHHSIQHGHLTVHAVPRALDYGAARAVENAVRDLDAAPHRQAVHELAVGPRIREPRLVDAPVHELLAQRLIAELVAVMARRRVRLGVDDMSAFHRLAAIRRFRDAAPGLGCGLARFVHDRGRQLEAW